MRTPQRSAHGGFATVPRSTLTVAQKADFAAVAPLQGYINRRCAQLGWSPEMAVKLFRFYLNIRLHNQTDGVIHVGVDIASESADDRVWRRHNRGKRSRAAKTWLRQEYLRRLAKLGLIQLGRGRFRLVPLTATSEPLPLRLVKWRAPFKQSADLVEGSAISTTNASPKSRRLPEYLGSANAEARPTKRDVAKAKPRAAGGRFAPKSAAAAAYSLCAAKAVRDVGVAEAAQPRTAIAASEPQPIAARAVAPLRTAVPGRLLEKLAMPAKAAGGGIPSHLRGADRAAWIEARATELAAASEPPAAPHAPLAEPAPPGPDDWAGLTDEQRTIAQAMDPRLRDRFVRMAIRLPASAPAPAAAAPPPRARSPRPVSSGKKVSSWKKADAPPASQGVPQLEGDDVAADATWLGYELATLPCMRRVEAGRSPPSVVQLVRYRYTRRTWRAAVAALLSRAPGTLKQSPVAFVLAMAKQLHTGAALDPRGSPHWFCMDTWGAKHRTFVLGPGR